MRAADLAVRGARPADYEAVAAMTRETWPDRDGGDYIPRIYHDWIADDGPTQRTLVAVAGGDGATSGGGDGATSEDRDEGEPVGICQAVVLSAHEGWVQGMRVDPEYRGEGVSTVLNDRAFAWLRERGATVARNMVFSWNVAGLGGSRAAGFEPATEFRWAHPDPDSGAAPDRPVANDPAAAWSAWQRSDARDALGGLALDPEESWAVSELTRERLERAAEETAVFAVQSARGTTGMSFRVRDYERERTGEDEEKEAEEGDREREAEEGDEEKEAGDRGTERWAEYGVGAWADLETARSLFAAIAGDAAAVGADRTRLLVPETPRHVSDAAYARAGVSDHPDFVLEADLTAER